MDTAILSEITNSIEREFGELNQIQINEKPDSKEWSIAQCIDHIIVSNEAYFPSLLLIAEGKYKPTFWETINPLTNYTGQRMIDTLGPEIMKKYKAPKIFLPSKTEISYNIIKKFEEHQNRLKELFNKLETKNCTGRVMSSPVAPLITLRVSDVMQIITVHEQRHLQQAIRIKKELGFS